MFTLCLYHLLCTIRRKQLSNLMHEAHMHWLQQTLFKTEVESERSSWSLLMHCFSLDNVLSFYMCEMYNNCMIYFYIATETMIRMWWMTYTSACRMFRIPKVLLCAATEACSNEHALLSIPFMDLKRTNNPRIKDKQPPSPPTFE